VSLEVERVRPRCSNDRPQPDGKSLDPVVRATGPKGEPSLAEAEVGGKAVRWQLIGRQGLQAPRRHAVSERPPIRRRCTAQGGFLGAGDDASQNHDGASDPRGRVEVEVGVHDQDASGHLAGQVEGSADHGHVPLDPPGFRDAGASGEPHRRRAVEKLEGRGFDFRRERTLDGSDLRGEAPWPEQEGPGGADKGRERCGKSSQCGLRRVTMG
jgi:hypothetical protein